MKKVLPLLLGTVFALGILLLLGAAPNQDMAGRYQIAAMGTDDWTSGLFIVDTATGVVKPVVVEDGFEQLGIPYEEMEPEVLEY
jgi:hypothetical protein